MAEATDAPDGHGRFLERPRPAVASWEALTRARDGEARSRSDDARATASTRRGGDRRRRRHDETSRGLTWIETDGALGSVIACGYTYWTVRPRRGGRRGHGVIGRRCARETRRRVDPAHGRRRNPARRRQVHLELQFDGRRSGVGGPGGAAGPPRARRRGPAAGTKFRRRAYGERRRKTKRKDRAIWFPCARRPGVLSGREIADLCATRPASCAETAGPEARARRGKQEAFRDRGEASLAIDTMRSTARCSAPGEDEYGSGRWTCTPSCARQRRARSCSVGGGRSTRPASPSMATRLSRSPTGAVPAHFPTSG